MGSEPIPIYSRLLCIRPNIPFLITKHWPTANYTAWRQKHMCVCEQLAQESFNERGKAEIVPSKSRVPHPINPNSTKTKIMHYSRKKTTVNTSSPLLTFPMERPPATERITPMNLHKSVLILTTCGTLIPFKKHLI